MGNLFAVGIDVFGLMQQVENLVCRQAVQRYDAFADHWRFFRQGSPFRSWFSGGHPCVT